MVGYSTPETVYEDSLEPGFQKTSEGSGVSFSNSFGASGDQSRAVEAGQPASVVHFSQAGDMSRLVDAGLVSKDWDKQPYGGIAQDSVVVMTVRKGNPKGLHSLDDLLTKDVSIVTPNPFSSGSARWNIMAVYGSQINEGKSPQQALDAVKTVLEKTKVQPGSARDALAAFTQGEGDVLLSYENEAIKAKDEGEDVDYVVPPSTILIQTPIAVTKDAPAGGPGVPQLHLVGRRPEDLGAERLPAGQPEAGRPEAVPDPEGPVHDRRVRRLGQGQRRVLRRHHRLGGEDRGANSESPPPASRMEAHATAQPAPRAGFRLPGVGAGLGRGLVTLYLSVIVLLPLAAVVNQSLAGAASARFWDAVTQPQAVAALELTVICSLIVVVINAIFGTIIAWVLVRDDFPGKAVVNAVIDLPFALPTIVAGLTLLALYGSDSPIGIHVAFTRTAVVVALLFVTLPFVVRAVQPLLIEMDREMEAAAASLGAGGFTIFRRIIFPNLLPGLAAGIALAFARALGEFGSLVLISGGLPKTEVSSVFIRQQIESGNDAGAAAVSVGPAGRLAAAARLGHLVPALGQPPRLAGAADDDR